MVLRQRPAGPCPGLFTATGLPTGLSISGAGLIAGTIDPRAANASPYTVVVQATHDGTAGSTTLQWTVNDATPPTVDNSGSQTSNEGAALTPVTFTTVDADADSLSATRPPPRPRPSR